MFASICFVSASILINKKKIGHILTSRFFLVGNDLSVLLNFVQCCKKEIALLPGIPRLRVSLFNSLKLVTSNVFKILIILENSSSYQAVDFRALKKKTGRSWHGMIAIVCQAQSHGIWTTTTHLLKQRKDNRVSSNLKGFLKLARFRKMIDHPTLN